jgi:hypothetical protein
MPQPKDHSYIEATNYLEAESVKKTMKHQTLLKSYMGQEFGIHKRQFEH